MTLTETQVKFTLAPVAVLGRMTNTIMVDGQAVQTIAMGESVVFNVPVGTHSIQLVQIARHIGWLFIPIKRKSNVLEVKAEVERQSVVIAEYDRVWGKFSLRLA